MSYNYFEAVCDDVREVIVENWADRFAEFESRPQEQSFTLAAMECMFI